MGQLRTANNRRNRAIHHTAARKQAAAVAKAAVPVKTVAVPGKAAS
jgi:hypothetical protein